MKSKFYKEMFLSLFITIETFGNFKKIPEQTFTKYNDYKNQYR